MKDRFVGISQRQAARIAGFGALIMVAFSLFAALSVRSRLIVPGDTAKTVGNIIAHELLFRMGNVSWLVVLILDVVLTWALYVLFKPVNKSLSLLAAWFRLVYTTIHGAALLPLILVLPLVRGADDMKLFDARQLHALALLLLNGHNAGFLIGLVFFGCHLLILGYLVFKSGYVPKLLGLLLMVAAFGYLIDSFANFLLPNYASYQPIVQMVLGVPMFLGEISFFLWLLAKGVNLEQAQ